MTNSRREFLKRTTAETVSCALAFDAASYAKIIGANDRINTGLQVSANARRKPCCLRSLNTPPRKP